MNDKEAQEFVEEKLQSFYIELAEELEITESLDELSEEIDTLLHDFETAAMELVLKVWRKAEELKKVFVKCNVTSSN